MKITVLIENNSKHKDLACEHGLAFYIEYMEKKYLFDSGQSQAMLDNAHKMGISLENLDAIFISHGHYDHSGALAAVMKKNPNVNVYIGKGFFEQKGKLQDGSFNYLGVPEECRTIQAQTGKFKEIAETTIVDDGIMVLADFSSGEDTSFVVEKNLELQPDFFRDEIAVIFKTEKGSVLISGCSHNGILNIIQRTEKYTKNIYALFGGFHTRAFDDGKLKTLAQDILKKGIQHIGISHCTGNRFIEVVDDPAFFPFNSGDIFSTRH